jgi:hypothetical protein
MRFRTVRTLGLAGGLALLAPIAVNAQDHKGCGCCAQMEHASQGAGCCASMHGKHAAASPAPSAGAPDAVAAPVYDFAYEGLIAGVIQSVMRHPGMDVELTLGVGEQQVDVLVAPMDWLDAREAAFRPGQRIEVVGARLDRGAGDRIVAREIHTPDQTIVLRDSTGRPLWN